MAGSKHLWVTVQTVCVTAALAACTAALNVLSLLRFTHSSSTLNESANHPMHWTSQTILYPSSGYICGNNDSLTQVQKAMGLNQYFYFATIHLNPLFKNIDAISQVCSNPFPQRLLLICQTEVAHKRSFAFTVFIDTEELPLLLRLWDSFLFDLSCEFQGNIKPLQVTFVYLKNNWMDCCECLFSHVL